MSELPGRIRRWTVFLIAGLVLSGATALPIASELEAGVALLGHDLSAGGVVPTDWLAFGHFMIALVFVGALRDPVRNRWLYRFGMLACASVPAWALLFGQIRGIPLWWRLIDASFGVVAFVPVWLCHRWSGQLEAQAAVYTGPP